MRWKEIILGIIGTVGGAVAAFFGGWTQALTILLVLNIMDYCSGLIVAAVFHASPKTENGRVSSREGIKGIYRKVAFWMLILVAHFVDVLLGVPFLRDAVAIGLIVNELISIIENLDLMGVPIPEFLRKGIDLLYKKKVAAAEAAMKMAGMEAKAEDAKDDMTESPAMIAEATDKESESNDAE